jgi:hypothetical protein
MGLRFEEIIAPYMIVMLRPHQLRLIQFKAAIFFTPAPTVKANSELDTSPGATSN